MTAHLLQLLIVNMKHCFAAFLSAAVLVSCAQEQLHENLQPSQVETTHQSNEQKEIYVYLTDEFVETIEAAQSKGVPATKAVSNTPLSELGIQEMYRLFPHAGEYEERTRREGLHKWYVLKYTTEVSKTKAAVNVIGFEGIEHAEPAYEEKINDTYYNDPYFSQVWGLDNVSKPTVDINVLPVWEEFTTGSDKVVVAVIDSGVDLEHEDLVANIAESGHFNYCDNNTAIEEDEHGTHVAGIIAAVGNNKKGVAGVAGGNYAKGQKGVKIVSAQGLRPDGSGSKSITALKESADKTNAVIAQNSWGANLDSDGDGTISESEKNWARDESKWLAYRNAIDYFIKYAGCDANGNQKSNSPMKGGIVIFAAGNDNIDVDVPSMYDATIAVASITKFGEKSSFSNYGDWVDICAPGSEVVSTIPGNSYASMDGTSMACPYVSGVAALLVSHYGGPGFTNEMLREKILGSINMDAVSSRLPIGGLVDAYGAFMYGNDEAPNPVTDLQVAGRGNNIDCTLTIPSTSDGGSAYGILLLYSDDRTKLENADASNYSEVGHAAYVPEKPAGETVTLAITRLEFEHEYYVKALAYSYGRNHAEPSEIVSVSTTANNAPVVTLYYEGDGSMFSYETLNIPVSVVDPDGHAVEVTHISGSDAETFTVLPDSWRLTLKGSAAEAGTYVSTIKAMDEFGLESEYRFEYTIKENSAPVMVAAVPDVFMTKKGQEAVIDMSEYVSDADGEQLAYAVSYTNEKVVYINVKGDILTATATAYGTADVTIIAKDARGESVTFELTVVVKDPSKPLSVYPNPVKDYVNVGTLDVVETQIVISSSTGSMMYDQTMSVGALEPARIDMRDFAPGAYTMTVRFDGKEYKETVVKL